MVYKKKTEPVEPKQFTEEWFDKVIQTNQKLAEEKLLEYHQLVGAVSILYQQKSLIKKE